MHRKEIKITKLSIQPHHLFDRQWALLTAGDYELKDFNAMTIGWGAIGTMWSKPFAFVAVRHSRYTYEFMEKYDTFTITAFPKEYHDALKLLGTKSGRDSDKIAQSGLKPEPSTSIAAPSFKEAELVIECRKVYENDLNPAHFLDESIYKQYPKRDFHRIYYGWIQAAFGTEKFSS